MDKFFDKLSEYNILNNVYPGVILVYCIKLLYDIDLVGNDVMATFFIYYFAGTVASRIGSLTIEKVLKKTKAIKMIKYSDYCKAYNKDNELKTLNCIANNYRSLASVFLVLMCMSVLFKFMFERDINIYELILVFLLFVLFILSYIKQVKYITQRALSTIKQK